MVEDNDKKGHYVNINAGGNVDNVQLVVGNYNRQFVHQKKFFLPNPEGVDIKKELVLLRNELANIATSDKKKIDNALEEAVDEVNKTKPDKNETGKAVERALTYAKKADEFNKIAQNLLPTFTKIVAWLGKGWYKLLEYFSE